MTHPRRAVSLALVAILAMAAGCCCHRTAPSGGGYTAAPESMARFTVTVKEGSTRISPETLTVRKGATVEWRLENTTGQARIVFDQPGGVDMRQDRVSANLSATAKALEPGRWVHHAEPLDDPEGQKAATSMVPAVLIVE